MLVHPKASGAGLIWYHRYTSTSDQWCSARAPAEATFLWPWPWSLGTCDLNHGLETCTDNFYRATHMHSADYAVRGKMSVCPSVCPSHPGIVCKRLHISSFFSPSGSYIILVFLYQTGWQYSDGDPPNGGVECKEGMKNHDFRPILGFISEEMQDRAIVTMEGE